MVGGSTEMQKTNCIFHFTCLYTLLELIFPESLDICFI